MALHPASPIGLWPNDSLTDYNPFKCFIELARSLADLVPKLLRFNFKLRSIILFPKPLNYLEISVIPSSPKNLELKSPNTLLSCISNG